MVEECVVLAGGGSLQLDVMKRMSAYFPRIKRSIPDPSPTTRTIEIKYEVFPEKDDVQNSTQRR